MHNRHSAMNLGQFPEPFPLCTPSLLTVTYGEVTPVMDPSLGYPPNGIQSMPIHYHQNTGEGMVIDSPQRNAGSCRGFPRTTVGPKPQPQGSRKSRDTKIPKSLPMTVRKSSHRIKQSLSVVNYSNSDVTSQSKSCINPNLSIQTHPTLIDQEKEDDDCDNDRARKRQRVINADADSIRAPKRNNQSVGLAQTRASETIRFVVPTQRNRTAPPINNSFTIATSASACCSSADTHGRGECSTLSLNASVVDKRGEHRNALAVGPSRAWTESVDEFKPPSGQTSEIYGSRSSDKFSRRNIFSDIEEDFLKVNDQGIRDAFLNLDNLLDDTTMSMQFSDSSGSWTQGDDVCAWQQKHVDSMPTTHQISYTEPPDRCAPVPAVILQQVDYSFQTEGYNQPIKDQAQTYFSISPDRNLPSISSELVKNEISTAPSPDDDIWSHFMDTGPM